MRAKNEDDESGRRSFLQLLVPSALCVLLGVIFSTQEFFSATRKGEAVSWVGAFADLMPFWLFWALLSPLIGWLSRRYRIEKRRWLPSLVIHLIASIFAASLYPALYILVTTVSSDASAPEISGRLHLFFFVNAHVFGIIIYFVVLTIILTLNYYRRYQEERLSAVRLQAQLKEAELQALRMQLHPHFLFNALHSVTALVLKNENREAVRMINRLSELLRLAIKDNDTPWVSLKQELEFLDRYLEIERIRFQDRLGVQMNIEPQTLDAEVPNLILQPLVENAVRHGIAMQSSPGTITLTASRQNDELRLEIRDDGPGLPSDWHTNKKNGVGLNNTKARLEQLYGSGYDFDLSNGKAGGTVAVIKLPFRTVEAKRMRTES